MAGTDRTRSQNETEEDGLAPAVILVEPQLGENIGMVARAMLNCGLTDLRIVRPRDGWPNDKALAASVGAAGVIEAARIFETTQEAVAGLQRLYAATARDRDSTKTVQTPRRAAAAMRTDAETGVRTGVLFGRESSGLDNDDIALADAILMVPLNPGFTSLNLAQAVFVTGYEWFIAADETPPEFLNIPKETHPAAKQDLIHLFEHLEDELIDCGFLNPPAKRPAMIRNIRNMLQRAAFTDQEVRTFRGIIAGLSRKRKG
ncbi:MAG: RNA methyltransferase [Rhodospirillales bacterium]|nr:RNA methyltransferase [Rhodospirillales bacterium]